jgi:acyl-coenzyme A thioesterase PaaI-like protein
MTRDAGERTTAVSGDAAAMCFACGKDNPIGLGIEFRLVDGVCSAEFTPTTNHVGWEDTVHGGILYTALDDVTANVLYQQGIRAYTARCLVRYRQPAKVGERLRLRGWLERRKGRLAVLRGEILRAADDAPVADCEASFIVEKAAT